MPFVGLLILPPIHGERKCLAAWVMIPKISLNSVCRDALLVDQLKAVEVDQLQRRLAFFVFRVVAGDHSPSLVNGLLVHLLYCHGIGAKLPLVISQLIVRLLLVAGLPVDEGNGTASHLSHHVESA